MAVFLLKSKFGANHVPPPAVGLFSDVPVESPFAPWVEEVAALQISVGCGGGKYCPSQPVTRGQMAVFLLKTLLGFDYIPPAGDGNAVRGRAAGVVRLRLDRRPLQPGRHRRLPGLPASLLPVDPGHSGSDGGIPREDVQPLAPFQLPPGVCLWWPARPAPRTPVTRGQMAVFLVRTFGL